MASPDDSHRLKHFLLAKEFAEVFQAQQFQSIPIRRLTQAYQSKHRKNFSPRQLGFSRNLENFITELPIFSQVHGGVILSRSKFLEFFFRPVFEQCGSREITGSQRMLAIVRTFKSCTGIEIESICSVLQANDVEELLSELTSNQGEKMNTRGAALHTQAEEGKECHGRTEGGEGELRVSQEDSGSLIRISHREQGRTEVVEGATPADRNLFRMDVDEPPLLTRPGPRVLLPHPQLPTHPVVSGSPPAKVLRPPQPQPPFLSQNHPKQAMPNIKPLWHRGNMPINPSFPQQITDPHHLHQEMVSPHRPHHDQMRGVHLISHQQPIGAVGGNVQNDPIHHPSPLSGGDLPEYLPLSPGLNPRSTPRRISSGSSPSLSPGPQPHVVAPQVIVSRMPPAAVRHPSPLSQQQPLITGEMDPKFPYPNLALGQETILPSHSAFRPDLLIPRTPPGATELSSSKKKKGAVSTKQKSIEKINAKVEELIGDLSSQGKFLQPDMVRRLVFEMINQENRGRQDKIILRDITAMSDYSKVHGRVEELIKVFCWFSPVTSLHELEQAIIMSEKVDNFEALHLGPITKHPKVIDLFKLQEAASLDTVPDISAYKIQNYLMKFLSKRKRSEKQSLEGFLEYVREREFAESVYHLCIRITSFPLAIQVGEMWTHSLNQVLPS